MRIKEVTQTAYVSLNDLENAVRAFQERVTDRTELVAMLAPEVADGERRVARLKEDVSNLALAIEEKVIGARLSHQDTQIKLKFAEDALSAFKIRLDTSTRVLQATKKLSSEWYKINGETLARLRKLTPRLKIGDKF